MNNYYYTIKAIKENDGATAAQIAKYGVANPSATISALRDRGHEIFTQMVKRKGKLVAKYVMPFGTRTEAQKLSRVSKQNIAKTLGLPVQSFMINS